MHEPLPVHMGTQDGGTHPLIQIFALEPSGCTVITLPITKATKDECYGDRSRGWRA